MERKSFLKSLITLIAAPALLGEIEIKSYDKGQTQTFHSDILRFHCQDVNKFRLGDLIVSDMGDKAMITSIVNFGNPYVEGRPLIRGRYNYRNLENIAFVGRQIAA